MSAVAVVGCTGLVGSKILHTLLAIPSQVLVHTIARRNISKTENHLQQCIETDSSKWPGAFASMEPKPTIFFSALGTTRRQAGSFDAQRAIDYDLNLALAKAARESGVKVYVLISSAGTSKTSPFPYGKMKAELEEAVSELGFDHTIILRPGLLVGTREDSRPGEAVARYAAKALSVVGSGMLTNFWAQDADVIGRAAVNAGMQCLEGERQESLWKIEQLDIVKLGKSQ